MNERDQELETLLDIEEAMASGLDAFREPDLDNDDDQAFDNWYAVQFILREAVRALERGMLPEQLGVVLTEEAVASAMKTWEADKEAKAERNKQFEGLTWQQRRRKMADMAKPGYAEREAAKAARAAAAAAKEADRALRTCIWCGKVCRTVKGLETHESGCQSL